MRFASLRLPEVVLQAGKDLAMKNFAMAVGLVALFAAGAANAATLYDSVDIGTPGVNSSFTNTFDKLFQGNIIGGPLGDSFSVSSPTLIKGINLQLWDSNAATDGGSTLVYLVPDNGSGLPTHTGYTLTNKTWLGTISDATGAIGGGPLPTSIPTVGAATAIVNQGGFLITTPGRYWIELVASTDPNNQDPSHGSALDPDHSVLGSCAAGANHDPLALCTRWVFNSGTATGTVGTTDEFTSEGVYAQPGLLNDAVGLESFVNGSLNPNGGVNGEFEMKINTPAPEPTTLAILGAGLLGLGLSRRRRAKKPTE